MRESSPSFHWGGCDKDLFGERESNIRPNQRLLEMKRERRKLVMNSRRKEKKMRRRKAPGKRGKIETFPLL